MATIYRCLARSHLEYCVLCWCLTPRFGNWGLILSIENVQRKFTGQLIILVYWQLIRGSAKVIKADDFSRVTYMRGDLIETFKVMRGFVDYGQSLFKIFRSELNLLSRGNTVSWRRKDFLGERVVNYWNNLPSLVSIQQGTL